MKTCSFQTIWCPLGHHIVWKEHVEVYLYHATLGHHLILSILLKYKNISSMKKITLLLLFVVIAVVHYVKMHWLHLPCTLALQHFCLKHYSFNTIAMVTTARSKCDCWLVTMLPFYLPTTAIRFILRCNLSDRCVLYQQTTDHLGGRTYTCLSQQTNARQQPEILAGWRRVLLAANAHVCTRRTGRTGEMQLKLASFHTEHCKTFGTDC